MTDRTTTGAPVFGPALELEDVERMADVSGPHMVGHRMALKILLHGSDWHLEQVESMQDATQTAATSYRNIAGTIRGAAAAWREQLVLMEAAAEVADTLAVMVEPAGEGDVVN